MCLLEDNDHSLIPELYQGATAPIFVPLCTVGINITVRLWKLINQINERLKRELNLDLTDFLLQPGKSVSGEALATKFRLTSGSDGYDVASLADICPAIRQIGGRGIDIKRFKGLGEMNAEQLWETTMNPATRTLLSVRLDDAGEADRLFSILMGDDVDKRRGFIQEHALEVQNLDV